jgi:hypothetical protein
MIHRVVLSLLVLAIAAPAFAADDKSKSVNEQDDPIGRKLSEQLGPYMQMAFLPHMKDAYLKDEKRQGWKKKYERLTVDEKVHYCIFQLKNESWWEDDHILNDEPYSKEPEGTPSREIVKLGRPAIPHLLRALECRTATGMTWNRFTGGTYLVQDAALTAIDRIACRFFGDEMGNPQLSEKDDKERQKRREQVVKWWVENKDSDEIQWAKKVLFSETAIDGGSRHMAIESLYLRLGKQSYPFLVEAYHRLPKGQVKADPIYETKDVKCQILQRLLKSPTNAEKGVFSNAVQDVSLWVQIDGAKGLWAIGDYSGLEALVKETEERLLKDTGSRSAERECEYDNLMSFLGRCNTPRSREAVYKCLRGQNPYLRHKAVRATTALRIEKAIRALPELFDDPFIVAPAYRPGHYGTISDSKPPVVEHDITTPALRICDEAAETFTKLVPDAPHFDGSTAESQQQSIDKLKQWLKENGPKLKWNEKRGVLSLPKKE